MLACQVNNKIWKANWEMRKKKSKKDQLWMENEKTTKKSSLKCALIEIHCELQYENAL